MLRRIGYVAEDMIPEQQAAYVNHNAKATPDEVRLGTLLHQRALAGNLAGVQRVEGAPEIPQQRSSDYRFIRDDGRTIAADLYQPESANMRSIAGHIMQKSGQATVVVIELGRGRSDRLTNQEAVVMVHEVLATPGHGIERILVIRNEAVITDISRVI